MNQIKEQDFKRAYEFWLINYSFKNVDKAIEPFLHKDISVSRENLDLEKIRRALFLSTAGVAEKLKISRTAYFKIEKREKLGTINIRTLSKIAEAMDCELIYAIRPKCGLKFSEVIWQKLLVEAVNDPWLAKSFSKAKDRALAALARKALGKSKFRKSQGWSERLT